MSSTLTVEPANRKKHNLPFELKKALQKKFEGVVCQMMMDSSDISYLNALVDLDIPGAFELIQFIEKYDQVILNEEF